MKNLINKIKAFFTHTPLFVSTNVETTPEAFGFSVDLFNQLLREMSLFIQDEDRVGSFEMFLESPTIKDFEIDLKDPRHAAMLGFIFCTVLMMQRNEKQKTAVEKVLQAFYPPTYNPTPPTDTKLPN